MEPGSCASKEGRKKRDSTGLPKNIPTLTPLLAVSWLRLRVPAPAGKKKRDIIQKKDGVEGGGGQLGQVVEKKLFRKRTRHKKRRKLSAMKRGQKDAVVEKA